MTVLARARDTPGCVGLGFSRQVLNAECRRLTGKPPVTVRWVDVNKGDGLNPNVSSRLVARQIHQAGEEAIFAPTPPLEALKSIISMAATDLPGWSLHVRDPESNRRTQLSFNASTDGSDLKFVMLPPEHPGSQQDMCGLLNTHMRHQGLGRWVATGILRFPEVDRI